MKARQYKDRLEEIINQYDLLEKEIENKLIEITQANYGIIQLNITNMFHHFDLFDMIKILEQIEDTTAPGIKLNPDPLNAD